MARELDLESSGVRQTGTAVLKAEDGQVVKSSGELRGDSGATVLAILYQMLLDTGNILKKEEPLQRILVSFSSYQYVMTLSEQWVYIIKRPCEEMQA
eukprot:CAMPEP_0113941156 /NCGR_PEP_ID=MMETSP1339-20121228/7140_1 /TAXON_ID=94617 /ORGANISM="Fibrocapsa japonica" /LENGTH=96 /DNA_ID=CAMNT_0000945221 /DNA_START=150 /DNA_END=440 /DNA_ORIENTATION=- /assembly_acc=CAM_ASM_000762